MANVRVPVAGTIGKSVSFDPQAGARAEAAVEALAQAISEGIGGTITHKDLLGLQVGDDHPQYAMWQAPETIQGLWNFQTIPLIQGETLAEYIEDVVGGDFFDFLQDTTSVVWTYHETANELEANVPPEFVQDTVGAMLTDTTSIDLSYDDTSGTFQAAIIDEYVQDLVGAMLTDSTSIDFTYSDVAGTFTAAVLPAGVDHNSLANLTTGDPHTQYPLAAGNETISGEWDFSNGLDIPVDSEKLRIGAGNDLSMYHDGTNSYIENITGTLEITVPGGGVSNLRVSATTSARVIDINSNHASGPYVTFTRSGTAFADFGNAAQLFSGGDLDGVGFVTRGADALELGTSSTLRWRGTDDGHWRIQSGALALLDGITAPSTVTGFALIYVDTADGDLKVKFGDGTVKVIVTD